MTPAYLRPLSFERVISRHNWDVAMREKTWPVKKKVRAAIYSRDNSRCYYCGATERLSIDHKVPRSVGGSDHSENLVTACMTCNGSKCAKHMSDFIRDRFHGGAA